MLTVVYPYLHVSDENTLREGLSRNDSQEWIEQGIYVQLDEIFKAGSGKFSYISDREFIIFVGLNIDMDSLRSRIENTWRMWSKVGLLSRELNLASIDVNNIAYFRHQPSSKNGRLSMFNYCIFVTIELQTAMDQIKCLNILQKLRGATMPGYVSLFQKTTSQKSSQREEDDFFDEILRSIEPKQGSKSRARGRNVNTV